MRLRLHADACFARQRRAEGVVAALSGHVVEEARSRGWDMLGNGELLEAAEAAGFNVILTTTKTFGINRVWRGENWRSSFLAKRGGD